MDLPASPSTARPRSESAQLIAQLATDRDALERFLSDRCATLEPLGLSALERALLACRDERDLVQLSSFAPEAGRPAIVASQPHAQTQPRLLADRYILYEALRLRARGGVFRALELGSDHRPKRYVVLKEATRHDADDPLRMERHRWQFSVMRELADTGFVPEAFELVELGERTLLSVESIAGQSLREHIWTRSLARAELHGLVLALAVQLVALHARGFFVVDFSPDNVVLVESRPPILVDLDAVVAPGAPPFVGWQDGSPGFFPSVARLAASVAPQDDWLALRDLFALGSTIAALYAPAWYARLFAGPDAPTGAWDAARQALPPALRPIVARLLLIDGRFTDARAAAEALRDWHDAERACFAQQSDRGASRYET